MSNIFLIIVQYKVLLGVLGANHNENKTLVKLLAKVYFYFVTCYGIIFRCYKARWIMDLTDTLMVRYGTI